MRKSLKVDLENDPLGSDLGVFNPNTFTVSDAFVLESTTGLTVAEMARGIDNLQANAIRAIVWFQKYKRGDNVHISAVDFNVFDLTVEVMPDPTVASSETNETPISESSHTSAI